MSIFLTADSTVPETSGLVPVARSGEDRDADSEMRQVCCGRAAGRLFQATPQNACQKCHETKFRGKYLGEKAGYR